MMVVGNGQKEEKLGNGGKTRFHHRVGWKEADCQPSHKA